MKNVLVLAMIFFSAAVFGQKSINNKVVDAACKMCQFNLKSEKGCAVAVKIDGKVYDVEGVDKKSLGDAHADDGYCNMMKKARVSGQIKGGKFFATKFAFVDTKK